jgi:hypothetical protein
MLRLQCPAQNYAWGRKPGASNGRKGSEVRWLMMSDQHVSPGFEQSLCSTWWLHPARDGGNLELRHM